MNDFGFCINWFGSERSPIKVVSEAQAQKLHEAHKQYTVTVEGFLKPTAIIIVTENFVPVMFLDVLLRPYLEYHFQKQNNGRIFLSMAIRRIFCDATDEMVDKMQAGRQNPSQPWTQYLAHLDKVFEGTSLIFKPDGRTIKQYEHFSEPYAFEQTELQYDASHHWEDYPEFGKYDHLLKKDRHLPW